MGISFFGNLLLNLSLFFCIITNLVSNNWSKRTFYLHIISVIAANFLLIFAFINNEFSIQNIFFNSSTKLPLIFKISASWASHESSILLFTSFMSLFSFLYLRSLRKKLKDFEISDRIKLEACSVKTFCQIIALFLIFIIYTSNPFHSFAFKPEEGLGLNPMLQDFAIAIHPPTLYFGNTCYIAVFVNGLLMLKFPQQTKQLIDLGKNFSNVGMFFLSAGIGLGAWWAYRELGWGGYWFFDPVENISIVPWLFAIILHHYLIMPLSNSNKTWQLANRYKIIILSFSVFLSVIYGTTLIRSGIISSVHAFAFSPKRGLFLLIITLIITCLTVVYFCFYYRKQLGSLGISSSKLKFNHKLINFSAYFWYISILIIAISLIYPIYYNWKFDSDVSINPNYYFQVFIPIFIPLILLCAMSFSSSNILPMFGAFIITAIINYYKIGGVVVNGVCFVGIFMILKSASPLLYHIRNHSLIPFSSKFFAHNGFALLALSICLNLQFTKEINFTGEVGQTITQGQISAKLKEVRFAKTDNYYRQIAIFEIIDQNQIYDLKPENSLSQEVDIISMIFHDYYAVLSKIDGKIISANIYKQKFINFIWFSVAMICLGFLIRPRR